MNIRDIIQLKSVAIVDGGLGSSLDNKNLSDPLLFSSRFILDNPEAIIECHKEYVNAGADVIISSSYQASYEGFLKVYPQLSYNDFLTNVCNESVRLARLASAHSKDVLVAGSIGSYGAHLADGSEFTGNFDRSIKKLTDWHRDKLTHMYNTSGADIIACETIPCISEVKALVSIFNDIIVDKNENKPSSSWISMSCKSANELNSEETIEDAVRAIEDPDQYCSTNKLSNKLDIGVNCTSPKYIKDIVLKLREFSNRNREIIVYPNKGEQWLSDSHSWQVHSAACDDDGFADLAMQWHEAGANVIGGCCRTTASTISKIRSKFSKLNVNDI